MSRRADSGSAETRKTVLNILAQAQTGRCYPGGDAEFETNLEIVHSYVLAQDAKHWFCSQASDTLRECALLLQRLHGYQSDMIQNWRNLQSEMIHRCAECAQAYEQLKVRLREVYLAVYDDQTLDLFAGAVNEWERDIVLQALKKINIFPTRPCSLGDIPVGVLFHLLNNIALCVESPDLMSMIRRDASGVIEALATRPIPRGLLVLAADKDNRVRAWAQSQIAASKHHTSVSDFKSYYAPVVEILIDCCGNLSQVASTSQAYSNITRDHTLFGHVAGILSSFSLDVVRQALEPARVIGGFKRAMVWISEGKTHDTGILRYLGYSFRTFPNEIWTNNPPTYPSTVFTTLIHEDRLEKVVCEDVARNGNDSQSLSWVGPFLFSVRDRPKFGDWFQAVVRYLAKLGSDEQLPELVRGLAMRVACEGINTLLNTNISQPDHADHLTMVRNALVENKSKFCRAAFGTGNLVARDFLGTVFAQDIEELERLKQTLTRARGPDFHEDTMRDQLVLHDQFWAEALRTVDASSLQFMAHIMARSAHIDSIESSALRVKGEHKEYVQNLGQSINRSLRNIRRGFSDLTARLVTDSEQLDPSLLTDIITLLFSPVPELHNAALEVFGECDGRKACIRFALTRQPRATLQGVQSFVDAFNRTVEQVVEVCSAAKSLVRCLVDVIEALCGPEGDTDDQPAIALLNDPSFDPLAREMLRPLWQGMCRALASIFARCPAWSDFFDLQEMVEWMRDALIFGRLMKAHVGTFTLGSTSSQTLSQSGNLETMRDVQRELVAWFRLTDAELLYQANELMISLLEGGLIPFPEVRWRLKRRLEKSDLPQVKKEHIQVILARYEPEEADQEPAKPGKRSRPTESDDVQSAAPASKFARRDSVIELSDDEPDVKLEQVSLNRFLQTGANKKPPVASTSKIFVSTIKPSTTKPPAKPKVPQTIGSGPLAKMRADAAARRQQTVAQVSSVQKNLANAAVKPSGSSRPPSRPASSASSAHGAEESSNSSASDEDDDDIKTTTLAGLLRTAVPPRKPDQPKRTMVVLEGPPVVSAQQKRLQELKSRHEEMKRRTARLKPNLEGLHEQILRWSIEHDGPTPLCVGGTAPKLNRVPPKFSSKKDYHDIFHPLLINECWSQILQAKEEGPKESVLCTIMTRCYVDNFTEIAFNIIDKMPERWFLAETDIVWLRSTDGSRSILAKITGFKRANAANQIASGVMRLSTPVEQAIKVQLQEQWSLSKIYSLSTINREYAALTTAEYYDLFEEIMPARTAVRTVLSDQRVKEAMRAHKINEPQAKAILGALGPPGTGKTSTICGLTGVYVSSARAAVNSSSGDQKDKRRLLICAPSNAAIDEVTKRLVDGVRNDKGQPLSLKVVRVGTESSMNVSVTANSLDSLVDERMAGLPKPSASPNTDIGALRQQLADIRGKIDTKRNELDQSEPGQRKIALENEFRSLKSQRATITGKLDSARDQQKNASRVLDAARRKFRTEILSEADVICSTLSGSGHEVLEPFEFETVIIDEAAQAIEIATLIPLRYGCKTCILVGDPQQLPPTVISQLASGLDYNQSLFVRLQRQNPSSVHLLSIQYRMHPTISAVPSRLFYQGRLQDGPNMAQNTHQVWHSSSVFGPYKFFDVAHGHEEAQSNHSQINREEANTALALYDRLKRDYRDVKFDYRIGIVSMYRGQVMHMKNRFQAVYGPAILKLIDFNTVDGFQGQEKDIIILSCVRAGVNVQTVGFLADERRMNVAITRSRSSLFILGHAATLERCNATWKTVVEDARTRECLVKCSKDFFQFAVQQKVDLPARLITKKGEPKHEESKELVRPDSSRPTAEIPEKRPAVFAAVRPVRPAPAPPADPVETTSKPTAPAALPARPVPYPSLPPKPQTATPSSSRPNTPANPISNPLPPKPLPPKPQNLPPRKKQTASAFIPKDKQKKTQLGGP